MTQLLQSSFSRGEISPSLYSRVDLPWYQSALRTCRNWRPLADGGVENRSGTRFIVGVKDHASQVRLIGFSFNTTQTYILEFGNLYIRVIKDGGQVVYSSGPNAGDPVEVVTPYTTADLLTLTFTQNADVMTIAHPGHPTMTLSRTAHDAWALAAFAYENGPFQDINSVSATTVQSSGSTGVVTLISTAAIFGAGKVGQLFYLEQKDFEKPWEAEKDVNTGDIRRSDEKYYKANNTAKTGTLRPSHAGEGVVWNDGGVDWLYLHPGWGVAKLTAVDPGGLSATATVLSRIPDSTVANPSPNWAFGAWAGDQGYPACVNYCSQRLAFAATPAAPTKVWMSRTDSYPDFGESRPIQSNDSLTFQLASRQVNTVRALLSLRRMAILTAGTEWVMNSGTEAVLKPGNTDPSLIGFNGAAQIQPLEIGDTALYIQAKGHKIRDLGAEINSEGQATGADLQDLTVLASHLVKNNAIQEWAWQQNPQSTVWMVRDDGVLLSMTYVREQQVLGWAHHDTDGAFESVACVSEGDEDALYVVVRRTVNGQTRRNNERMETRKITDIRTSLFMDSGLSFDGRNTTPTTITLTGGTAWAEGETLDVEASDPIFAFPGGTDLEDALVFEDASQRAYTLVINAVTSTTTAQGVLVETLPAEFRGVARADWAWARGTITGADHLEGKQVSILADGNVEASQVVAGGKIYPQRPARFLSLGLPYLPDLETLDLVISGQETIAAKKKNIAAVSVQLLESRGLFVGRDFDHLAEHKERTPGSVDLPVPLVSGLVIQRIPTTWSNNGRVCIRQPYPLPITITGIIPEFAVGG